MDQICLFDSFFPFTILKKTSLLLHLNALNVEGRLAVAFENIPQLERGKMLWFWKIYLQMPLVPAKVEKLESRSINGSS